MVQAILTMKSQSTPGAYRVIGATASQIGTNFGTAESTNGTTDFKAAGRVIQFQKTTAIAGTVTTNGTTTITGSGTAFATLLSPTGTTGAGSGGAIIEISNQPGVFYTVANIASATSLTLITSFTGASTSGLSLYTKVLLVAWIRQELYTYDGSVWILRYTLSPTMDTSYTNIHSGLYIVPISGVRTIVGFYTSSSGQWKKISSADGITWAVTADLGGQGDPHLENEIMFNNVFYCGGSTNGSPGGGPFAAYSIDASSNTFSTYALGNITGVNGRCFCAFNNVLYMIAWNATGVGATLGFWLYALSAGAFTPVVRIAGQPSSPTATSTVPTMFAPGNGKIYSMTITYNGTNTGILVNEITPAGLSSTTSDISSTVLPSSLQYPNNPSNASTMRFESLVETETSPTSPTTHIWIMTTYTGVAKNYYMWNGNATLIGNGGVANDSGGDVSMSLPSISTGAGEYIWNPNDFDISITAVSASTNGENIDFILFGPLGNESKTVKIYISGGDIDKTLGTLSTPSIVSGPATTPTLTSGYLTNVTADGGTANPTIYRVRWEGVTDGYSNNQKVRRVLRVE